MPDLSQVAQAVASARSLTIEGPVGSGAYKQTFRARDTAGRAVAVKVAASTGSLAARLEREMQALGDCCHEGVARLIDVTSIEFSGAKYLVSIEEYVSGGTLSARLATGLLTPRQTRDLVHRLASALGHLHARKLVHRDIKPENILYRDSGEPVLTDFGLVRMLSKESLTHDHFPMGPGTPLYAAPEQLLNVKAEIDWRTDQFGLGLVACRCLLDVHPFAPGAPPADAVACVAQRGRIADAVKAELQAKGLGFVTRMLDPWPVARFRWPSDLLDATVDKEA